MPDIDFSAHGQCFVSVSQSRSSLHDRQIDEPGDREATASSTEKVRKIYEKTFAKTFGNEIASIIEKTSRNKRKWRPGDPQKRARAPHGERESTPERLRGLLKI